MSSPSDIDVDQKIKTTKKQIVEIMTYLEGLKSMTDDLSRHIFPSIFHHISNIYIEVLKADPVTLDATTSYVRKKLQARGDVYPPMHAFRRKSKKSTRKGKKSMRKTKRSARK